MLRRSPVSRRIFALGILCAAAASVGHAQVVVWGPLGNSNLDWTNGPNWVGGVAPTSGKTAEFDGGASAYMPSSSGAVSIAGITFGASSNGGSLALTNITVTSNVLENATTSDFSLNNGNGETLTGTGQLGSSVTFAGPASAASPTSLINISGSLASSGTVTVTNGLELVLSGSLASFAPSSITVSNGADLEYYNRTSSANTIINNSSVTFGDGTGLRDHFGGSISGTGQVNVNDPVVLTGTNTYSGATVVSNSNTDLEDGATNSYSPNSTIKLLTGTSLYVIYNEVVGGIDTSGAASGANIYVGGEITLKINGNSTLTGSILTAGESETGGYVTIAGGTTNLYGTINAANLTISGGTLNVGNGTNLDGFLNTPVVNNSAIVFQTYDDYVMEYPISGTGNLTVSGPGLLSLAAANTYSGATTVNNAYLLANGSSYLSPNSVVHLAGEAVLEVRGNNSIKGLVSDGNTTLGNVKIASEATLTITGASTFYGSLIGDASHGTGSLAVNGSQVYTLLGSIALTKTTVGAGATLNIGNGGTIGTIGGDIVDNGTLVFNRSNDYIYSDKISGGGDLTKLGGGTLTLNNDTCYGGTTYIQNGTLSDGASNVFADGTPIVLSTGATLQVNYNETVGYLKSASLSDLGRVIIASGSTLSLDAGDSSRVAYYGLITGQGGLEVGGDFIQNLYGANDFTGGTTIDGTLILRNSIGTTGLGTGPITVNDGGFLDIGDTGHNGSINGTITIFGGGNVQYNQSGAITVTDTINGAGSLAFTGTATTTINGAITNTGGVEIVRGTVNLNGFQLGSTGGQGVLVDSNGTLTGSGAAFGQLQLNSGGSVSPVGSSGPTVITADSADFQEDGVFVVSMNNATGTAGQNSGWSKLTLLGHLTISADSDDPFVISLTSLSGTTAGNAANFDQTSKFSWLIVQAAGGLDVLDPTAFTINTSGFSNASSLGYFSLSETSTQLYLNFTPVPEPSTWALLGCGALVVGGYGFVSRRRRSA